mgnify:CR=1 FL=1
MAGELKVSVGQYSHRGRKETNQDFHGACIPAEPLLSAKGVAIALADGISSSSVSHVASQSAVTGFLEDYYSTPDSWSVKTSARRVLNAANSWLHAQTRQGPSRFDADKGYVCAFSAMVVKAATAHIFHVGDIRIFRLQGQALEQLTIDHRVVVSPEQSYLGRALGATPQVETDYLSLQLEAGDVFLFATDGVYEWVDAPVVAEALSHHGTDLDRAAQAITDEALRRGSTDNLTAQLLRIEALPDLTADALQQHIARLSFPPILTPRTEFDGYHIVRELHGSHRSHIYLAVDSETNATLVLKTPSADLRDDPAHLERFLLEEWIARRIDNPHVLKAFPHGRRRRYLYVVMEFVEGQTLQQWMTDNPRPDLESVRRIVEQVARGLQAFHRREMLHQDLRPQNVLIDRTGTAKIIDFGSTRVAGVAEAAPALEGHGILGTLQYTAPEYFLGEGGTPRSDLFSLAVVTYQMLTGRLPYGVDVVNARTRAAQNRLKYRSALEDDREIPAWIDGVLKKALHPNPWKRYAELSEFVYDLRHPGPPHLADRRPPLMESRPLLVWKAISAFLLAVVIGLLYVKTPVR